MPRTSASTSDIFIDEDQSPIDIEVETPAEAPDRRTRENVLEYVLSNYREVDDVIDHTNTSNFRRQAINSRSAIDARLKEIRDAMRPWKLEEKGLLEARAAMDKLFIEASGEGASAPDRSLVVESGPESQRWSKGKVEKVCKGVGITYQQAVDLAGFGVKAVVKLFT